MALERFRQSPVVAPEKARLTSILAGELRPTTVVTPERTVAERTRLSPVVVPERVGQNAVVAGERLVPRLSVVMTTQHLSVEQLPLRVLTAMGGLFYPGQLNAITAPDVYGIIIDRERGKRTHIFSREEILKDTVSAPICFQYRIRIEGVKFKTHFSVFTFLCG